MSTPARAAWLLGPWADRALWLLVSAAAVLTVHWPLLREPLRHYPDVVTAYPLAELVDPGRYAGDPIREMSLRWGFPPLYKALLLPLLLLWPVLPAMKAAAVLGSLTLPQLLLSLPGRAALRFGAAGAALGLALTMDSLHGFFPRAVGLLVTAAFLVALLRDRPLLAGAIAAGSTLAYPMVFPPSAAALVLLGAWRWRQGRWSPRRLAALALALALSLTFSLWRSGLMAAEVGRACTAETCPDMPELGMAGNYTHSAARGSLLLDNVFNLGEHTPAYPWVLAPLLLGALVAAARGRLGAAWAVLGGSALAYLGISALTALSPMPTGFASRAFVFALPLVLAWGFGQALDLAVARARGALALALLPAALGVATLDLHDISDDHGPWAPVLAAVEALPEGALLGGHPATLDHVPLLTGRRVVVIAEVFNPGASTWWRAWKARTDAALDATYAPRPEQVRAWCAEWGVSHLLVEGDRFDPELATVPRKFDWEPMASRVRAMAARHDAALAAVARPGEVCLLPCQGAWEGSCWLVVP